MPNGVHVTIPKYIVDDGGHIRQAVDEDVYYLAANLRSEDKDEIKASSGLEPDVGLAMAIKMGAWVGVHDAGPWVIWGNFAIDGLLSTVWCLATNQLKDHRSAFIRVSKAWLDSLEYAELNCFTDSRNREHHRWLKSMGFKRHGEPKSFFDPVVDFHEYRKGLKPNV